VGGGGKIGPTPRRFESGRSRYPKKDQERSVVMSSSNFGWESGGLKNLATGCDKKKKTGGVTIPGGGGTLKEGDVWGLVGGCSQG